MIESAVCVWSVFFVSVLGASHKVVKMADANNNKGLTRRKKAEVCGHCNSRVDQGICCDCCKFWVHFTCEGLTKEEAGVWTKLGARAKFYCTVRNCEQIAVQFINSIGPLKDQVDSNTKRLEELERRLSAQESDSKKTVAEGVDRAKDEVNKVIELEKENMKREIQEEVKRTLETRPNPDPEPKEPVQVKKEVQKMLDDEKDKAFRAKNLILGSVPEPDTDDLDVGKAADLEYVTKLFTSMKVGPENYKVVDTNRLHSKRDADNNARLLRVRFEAPYMVDRVARATPELSAVPDPAMKKVRIFRDRSKAEREKRQKLITLAVTKTQEENDQEFKWVVDYKNMDVIRVPKETQSARSFRQRKYR